MSSSGYLQTAEEVSRSAVPQPQEGHPCTRLTKADRFSFRARPQSHEVGRHVHSPGRSVLGKKVKGRTSPARRDGMKRAVLSSTAFLGCDRTLHHQVAGKDACATLNCPRLR